RAECSTRPRRPGRLSARPSFSLSEVENEPRRRRAWRIHRLRVSTSSLAADMKDRAAILPVAAMIGIEADYTDALGQAHMVSDDTLLALIAACGLPADPRRAKRDLEDQERSSP